MDAALTTLHEAIRTYQCPGCGLAAECPGVQVQPLKNGCASHRFSEMVFGAPHGIVLGLRLDGPGWMANGLPPGFNVFSARSRTFPILQSPPGKAGKEVTAAMQHLDEHGNTLVRWYLAGRVGMTTVHLGDVRAALPGVPELTREHLDALVDFS